jgi:hypothetical protein
MICNFDHDHYDEREKRECNQIYELNTLRTRVARLEEALREMLAASSNNPRFFGANPPMTDRERAAFDEGLAALAESEGK